MADVGRRTTHLGSHWKLWREGNSVGEGITEILQRNSRNADSFGEMK